MAFVESLEQVEPTHRLVTRRAGGADDWDDSGPITVENLIVDVVCRYGEAVHLQLAAETNGLEGAKRRLERIDADDGVFASSRPEYRAILPDDLEIVRSTLAVDPGDTDAWIDRLHGIEEFAVVTTDDWCYRSVPHHAHIRELNAKGRDEMLGAATAELESVPRSAIVPVDGFVTWRSRGDRYELHWDTIRRRDAESDRWTTFELERLRGVSVPPTGTELDLEWEPTAAESVPRRLLRRVVDPASADPPNRLAFPDRDVRADVVASLRELRAALAYHYGIDSNG